MKAKNPARTKLQIQLLLSQLAALRRELRQILCAYEARLELTLAEIVNELTALKTAKRVPIAQLHQLDKMIASLRSRKLKPEKGRRKDLRKLEDLIKNLHEDLLPDRFG